MADEHFSSFDLANGAADKISPPPDFDGPVRSRRITDPLCFLVLLGTWGVTSWMGVWLVQKGNYNTFVLPTDYKGRVCGFDKDDNGNELGSLWHPVDSLSNGVCVEECPTQTNLAPSDKSEMICKDDEDLLAIDGCLSNADISDDPDVLLTCGGCMYSMGINQMKYKCIPENVGDVIDSMNSVAEGKGFEPLTGWGRFGLESYITTFMTDLHTSFYVVIGGVGGSALLGLLFLGLFLVPRCIPFIIWGSTALVPFAFGGGGAFLWLLSRTYNQDNSGVHSEFKTLLMKVLAIAFWSISGILLIIIILLRQKINLAIALTKAGTRAIREIKLCFLLPILQFFSYAILLGVMAVSAVYFATTGIFVEETENVFGKDVTFTTQKFTTFAHYK